MVLAKQQQPLHLVRALNFWSCQLSDVEIIARLPSLEVCSLPSNLLDDTVLAILGASCPLLKELYLRENRLSGRLVALAPLTRCPQLTHLWLGQPVAGQTQFHDMALRTCPQLVKLETDNITPEQRRVALSAQLSPELEAALRQHQPRGASAPQDSAPQASAPQAAVAAPASGGPVRVRHELVMGASGSGAAAQPAGSGSAQPASRAPSSRYVSEARPAADGGGDGHVLQAVLLLLRDLDAEALERVVAAAGGLRDAKRRGLGAA